MRSLAINQKRYRELRDIHRRNLRISEELSRRDRYILAVQYRIREHINGCLVRLIAGKLKRYAR